MTVLRDAGAAAIYGTNAANGVVLITTKRGKARARRPSSSTPARCRPPRSPGCPRCSTRRSSARRWSSTRRPRSPSCRTRTPTGSAPSTGPDSARSTTSPCRAAGTANDYRLSLQLPGPEGHHRGNSAQRIGLGANFNQRLADDRLNLRFNLRGSRADDKFTPLGVLSNAAQYGPTQPIDDPTAGPGSTTGPIRPLTSADNPVAILNLAEEKAKTYRAIGNVQTEYRLPWVDGLRANAHPRLRRERRASGGTSPRAPCTGSWRPAEAASRPATIRTRRARCWRRT